MAHSTYSFTDIVAVISHPSYGQYSTQGEGTGSLTVSKPQDRTAHNVAADGHVMVSKIAGDNGNITIEAQQTSPLHKWLQGLFNYLKGASTEEWAMLTINIRAPKMAKTITGTGGSFQKEADEPFQQQGQNLSWVLMFADIQKLAI